MSKARNADHDWTAPYEIALLTRLLLVIIEICILVTVA